MLDGGPEPVGLTLILTGLVPPGLSPLGTDLHNSLMSNEQWLENRVDEALLGVARFLHRVFGDAEMHWLAFEDGRPCTADFCELDGKSYVVDAILASPFGDEFPDMGWAPEARVRRRAVLTTASTSTPEKLTRDVTLMEITDSAVKLRVVNLAVSDPLRAHAAAALDRVAVFEVTAALPALRWSDLDALRGL
jgi:hypothetical protein